MMKPLRMIRGTAFLVLLLGMVAPLYAGQEPQNLIQNPSFEAADGDRPARWRPDTWSGQGDFEYASIGRTGGRSAKISSRQGGDISWRQTVTVKPRTKYRLSAWIKTEDVRAENARGALLNVHNIQSVATPAVKGTKDWTRVETVFNSEGNTSLQLNCLFGGWGQATGTAWYDDVSLVEVDDRPQMYYTDTSQGGAFAKDPDVARFNGAYWMYYTQRKPGGGIAVGIARGEDLVNWSKVGQLLPGAAYEANGLGAPAAIVIGDTLHLFYQTYGNGRRDAICHAWTTDGINFTRNETNPIFRPSGDWTSGRAIDADVVLDGDRMLLYWATRDPGMKTQMVGVAEAPVDSGFVRKAWKQLGDGAILKPELSWEKQCIEAASVVKHDGRFYMFYAGAYNNQPQQIGCAVSDDGVQYERLSQLPLLPNGQPGEWNSSESGHPGVFVDDDGRTYLFFQGNNDNGKTWHLSKMRVEWEDAGPYLVQPRDGRQFHLRQTKKAAVAIDPTKTSEPISEYIYGQFIEHLGRCIYGGIWAEMLEDRKFYFDVPARGQIWRTTGAGARVLADSPWKVLGPVDAISMTDDEPLSGEQEPQLSLRQDVPVGIYQEELALEKGREYTGRVVLAADGNARVDVTLVWGDGDNQRQTVSIRDIAADHKASPLRFTAAGNSANGRLEIAARGSGVLRIGAVSLMPADNVHGFRKDTLALLRELDSPIYRWPGGNFVSGYDWRDGLGLRDRRPTRTNPAWTGIETNDVGMHEFVQLCRLIDAEPLITVNTGFGDAYSAAAEVEYANGAPDTHYGGQRAENGHEQPFDVKFWCVGNEMWGNWQLGHMQPHHYVLKHNWVEGKMREVDPDIVTIGSGDLGGGWSENLLRHCSDHMDAIAEHFYCQERGDLLAHVRQVPSRIKEKADAHRRIRESLDVLDGKDIRIAMTEWNYWYGPHVFGELGTRYFMKDALGIAAGFHEYYRNSDMFHSAFYAQTVNVIGAIKTTTTAAGMAATGQVLKLYRTEYGVTPVQVAGDHAPLDVAAALTEDGEAITIAVVNPTQDVYELDLSAEAGLADSGTMWRIQNDDPMAYNEPGEEPAVAIERSGFAPADGWSVPPVSITLYRLDLR